MGIDLLSVLTEGDDAELRTSVASSLLRYFIDPHTDHGIGARLLREILYETQGKWPAVDEALLDSLRYYPWIPDLDIEVTGAGAHRFVVTILYETGLYAIGIQTTRLGFSRRETPIPAMEWTVALRDPFRSFCTSRSLRITAYHRAVITIGPANDTDDANSWVGIDTDSCIPWKATHTGHGSETRSLQEILDAMIDQLRSGCCDSGDRTTEEILHRFYTAIGSSFRFDRRRVSV